MPSRLFLTRQQLLLSGYQLIILQAGGSGTRHVFAFRRGSHPMVLHDFDYLAKARIEESFPK